VSECLAVLNRTPTCDRQLDEHTQGHRTYCTNIARRGKNL